MAGLAIMESIVPGVVLDPPRSNRCASIRKNRDNSFSRGIQVACCGLPFL